MKRRSVIPFAVAAVMVFATAASALTAGGVFNDVNDQTKHVKAIEWAHDIGLVHGNAHGNIRPDAYATRAWVLSLFKRFDKKLDDVAAGEQGPEGPQGPQGEAGASAEDQLGTTVGAYLDSKVNGYVQALGPDADRPWDWSSTRTNGFHVFTPNGLFVATTAAASSQDKVAGYLDVDDFALVQLTGSSLDYEKLGGTFAYEPGLQAVVDLDNNGTPDGILVGEEVYGGNWWLASIAPGFDTSSAPTVGGGGGQYNGSIAQWLAGYPDAQVSHIGFSLGSGVYSIGQITGFTIGGTTYDFTS